MSKYFHIVEDKLPHEWGKTWREIWEYFHDADNTNDPEFWIDTFKMNVTNGYNTVQGSENLNRHCPDDEFIGVVMAFYRVPLPTE